MSILGDSGDSWSVWNRGIIISSDKNINGFRAPFRKYRTEDGHGGVAVYVKIKYRAKGGMPWKLLLKMCVFEIRLHSKCLLVGTFYQPPYYDSTILTHIENSIDLARDTKISEIIILGDFNLDINKTSSVNKINNICQQFNLHQMITKQTHFTERSSSLIDIILVVNPSSTKTVTIKT